MNKINSILSKSIIPVLLIASGCSSTGSSGDIIQGLPKAEFNRVFLAGIQVGAAEHCDDPVNSSLIRSNLLEFQSKKGLESSIVDRSGKQYDSTRADYKSRIENDPDFCTTEYKPSPEKLRQYENGQFPEVT